MLEFLRRQSQSWLVWLAMGVITVVFIFFFGPQATGFQQGSKSWAMRVNGTAVYDSQLVAAMSRATRLGQRFEDENYAEMKREVARDVALVHLLGEEAKEAGLSISDAELECYIVNWNRGYRVDNEFICRQFPRTYALTYPNVDFNFYSDREGQFSTNYAADVRRWFAVSVKNYETYKRQELLALRYLHVLATGIPVTDKEVEQRWRARNDGINLEYVIFDGSDLTPVTEEEIEAFAAENDAAMRTRFDVDHDAYVTERSVQLRRIYIRKPDGEAAEAEAKQRVDALVARAQEDGADFEALAREFNEIEREADLSGDMGERTASNIAPEFLTALEGVSPNGVVLVEQNYAWSITQLVRDTPAGVQPYEDVRLNIADAMLNEARGEEAKAKYSVRAQELLAAAATQSLADAAAALGDDSISVKTTGVFGIEPTEPDLSGIDPALLPYIRLATRRVNEIPGIGESDALMAEALALTEEAPIIGRVVGIDGKLVVIRLKERVTNDAPDENGIASLRVAMERERSGDVVGFELAQRRVLIHSAETLPPMLQALLDSADIRFREKLFVLPEEGAEF